VQVVVPGWEILDVFGPLEILFSVQSASSHLDLNTDRKQLSYFNKMTLSIIAPEVGPVPAGVPPHSFAAGLPKTDYGYVLTPQIQSTHTFANAPALDILFVAGGFGIVALDQENSTIIEDFIVNRFPRVEYIVGISLGVVPLAKAGILNGKRATTNKSAWSYVTTGRGSNISWVPSARWVQDGKVWTSSGVAAGKSHHSISTEGTERIYLPDNTRPGYHVRSSEVFVWPRTARYDDERHRIRSSHKSKLGSVCCGPQRELLRLPPEGKPNRVTDMPQVTGANTTGTLQDYVAPVGL